MRIGILGGTFNPIHNGHLYIAKRALKELCLAKIIFVPVNIPPHKKISGNATTADRVRMLRTAIKGKKRFVVSTYEITRRGKSYSIRTVNFFRQKYGSGAEFFFLIGADSLNNLRSWKGVKKLRKITSFAAVPRAGHKINNVFSGVMRLNIPKKDVSSTKIREMVKNGLSIRRLVPAGVSAYINEKRLYK